MNDKFMTCMENHILRSNLLGHPPTPPPRPLRTPPQPTPFRGSKGGSNWKFKKLDMPLFDGVNPDDGIICAKCYFDLYRLAQVKKVEGFVVGLKGDGYSGINGRIGADRSVSDRNLKP